MCLMLAGLRGIDEEIWKASRVDGIPKWRTYLFIVIPMMRPVFVTTLVIIAVGHRRVYDLVVAQTGGGPGIASEVPAKYVYDYMFHAQNLGQGFAASTMMLLTVAHRHRALGLSRIRAEALAWLTRHARRHDRRRRRDRADLPDRAAPRPRRAFSRRNIFIYGTLIVVALYYLLPLYVMIVTSLKGMPEIRLGNIFAPPLEITFEPWVKAWATRLHRPELRRAVARLLELGAHHRPSVILSIAIASVNGYALANWRFKGAEIFFTILIVGAFIPYQVMIYPIVIMLREIGIYGTLSGLVIVHSIFGMPILTLLFRNYFASLPEELFKAARVDGAGFWGIYFKIMLPMSLPIFVVAIILQVTGIWNDFLFGVVYTRPDNYPMTVQLNNIVNSVQGVKEYNVNMAATILTGLVPLIIYFISGKLFVRGIAAGAVKG